LSVNVVVCKMTFSSALVIASCLHRSHLKAADICIMYVNIYIVWCSITDEALIVDSGILEPRHCLYCCWNETRSWKGKSSSRVMRSYYVLYRQDMNSLLNYFVVG